MWIWYSMLIVGSNNFFRILVLKLKPIFSPNCCNKMTSCIIEMSAPTPQLGHERQCVGMTGTQWTEHYRRIITVACQRQHAKLTFWFSLMNLELTKPLVCECACEAGELTERTTAFARLYFKVLFLKLFFAPKLTVEELLCSVSSNKLLLYCVLLAANKQECFLVKIIKNLQLQQLIRNLGCCSKRLS